MSEQSPFADHTARSLERIDDTAIPDDLDLVIEQRIVEAGNVVEQYWVVFRDGAASVRAEALDPDIVISQDPETAHAIQAGTSNAQTAYLTGRLTIDGDVDKLLTVGPGLQSIVAVLAPTTRDDA